LFWKLLDFSRKALSLNFFSNPLRENSRLISVYFSSLSYAEIGDEISNFKLVKSNLARKQALGNRGRISLLIRLSNAMIGVQNSKANKLGENEIEC
jgi:hypothetical protein